MTAAVPRTLLRVDAPAADWRWERRRHGPWLATGVLAATFGGIGALITGGIAVAAGDASGIVLNAVALAGCVTFGLWYGYWEDRRTRWQVTIELSEYAAFTVGEAHAAYWQLSEQARDRALELVCAMYRIAADAADVRGASVREVVEHRLSERLWAVQRLVDAEDRVRLAVAAGSLDDRDDLDNAVAWQEALAEVEARLGPEPLP